MLELSPLRLVEVLKGRPDLLREPFRTRVLNGAHPLTGHCYVASEVWYHLYGKHNGYKPYVMHYEGSTHWYLMKKVLSEGVDPHWTEHWVFDITVDQFETPPTDEHYKAGRCNGFLTKEPSKRAQEVIKCLQKQKVEL